MKKLFILSVAAAFFLAACGDSTDDPKKNGDGNGSGDPISNLTVEAKNTSFVTKFSGTNCPPCGGWGWTAYSDIISGTPNSVHLTAYSQNFVAKYFITTEATSLDDKYGVTGYPTFGANGAAQLARSNQGVNVQQEIQMCKTEAAAHEAKSADLAAAISYEVVDGKVKIYYKVKAFKAMEENNYLAIYVLEDKVVGYQAGHSEGSNAVHKHVLRKGVEGAWGIQLGPMTADQEISGSKEVPVGTDPDFGTTWNADNIEVVGVMRYRIGSGGVYEFINAAEGARI